MTRINSKKKGNRNERVGAKAFQEWVGKEFVRVPQSGGLHWGSGLMVTGDIIPADPAILAIFPFSIEMKFYSEITFQDLILPNNSTIRKFWEQSKHDAISVRKYPLVLFRYNRMKKGLFFTLMGYKEFIRIRRFMKLPNGWFNYQNEFVIFTSDNLFETNYPDIYKTLGLKTKITL